MIELDIKDRKILYYLLQDSRQSLKTIGKKVGISRESATYRIKRLIDNKIITKFNINVNTEKLGYATLNVYFAFKNINPEIKKRIISFFVDSKFSTYVSLLEGKYDFQVELIMGDPFEFESFFDKMQEKFYKYLILKNVIFWIRADENNYIFLLNEINDKDKYSSWSWGQNIYFIDSFDFKILSELYNDSRRPTKFIANNLGSTVSIVNNRIKKLIKNNIITQFTINVDWSKLGYRWFHLQINLNDFSKKNLIIQYIRENPNLIRIMKGFLYNVTIHSTFLLKNIEEIRKITEDISTRFPNSIENISFYSTFKIFKHYYMVPNLIVDKNPINRGKY